MAKRFTDTELWDKDWFMSLSCKHKCLVRYIFDKCDNAGVWSPNWSLASTYIGEPVNVHDIAPFGSQVDFIGSKIFIIDFIAFQYGELSEKCKPHLKVINLLKKHGLYDRVLKGYTKTIEPLEEEEEDKEEEREKEVEEEKDDVGSQKLLVPQMLQIFKSAIPNYPDDRERDSRALLSIAKFLCQRGNLRGAPEHHVVAIIEAWEQIGVVIAADPFYCQKSLSTISNHIQEIIQKALNGDKSKPATGNSKGSKPLNDDKLKAGIRDRVNQWQRAQG